MGGQSRGSLLLQVHLTLAGPILWVARVEVHLTLAGSILWVARVEGVYCTGSPHFSWFYFMGGRIRASS